MMWTRVVLDLTMNVTPTKATAFPEQAIARGMWIYISPFILVTGSMGNILSFVLLSRAAFRTSASSLYLRFVAVADTFALIFGLLANWIKELWSIDITTLHSSTCKLRNFLFYTSADIAIWLVVVFTLDRVIAVKFPLKRRVLCTRKKAKYISASLVFIGILKNAHLFWTRTVIRTSSGNLTCTNPTFAYLYFNRYVRPWIVFALSTLGPFVAVTVFNAIIIHALWKNKKKRSRITNDSSFDKTTRHMTCMILAVSCSFIILLTPSIVLLIGRAYWTSTPSADASYQLARAFGNLLVYIHHSCNFLLYCITGSKFRNELKTMICKGNRVGNDSISDSTTTQDDHVRQTPGTPPGATKVNIVIISDAGHDTPVQKTDTGQPDKHANTLYTIPEATQPEEYVNK